MNHFINNIESIPLTYKDIENINEVPFPDLGDGSDSPIKTMSFTVSVDQSKVDEARVELNKLVYKDQRRFEYPNIGDQLDNLYKDILAGKVDATGEFAKAIKTIKDKYPKS